MFEERLIRGLNGFNRMIHVLLALALVVASLMVVWDFVVNLLQAWQHGSATLGFIHALGSLFILWTLATLISAEINYLRSGAIFVLVFVEVGLISAIRELIMQPMQSFTNVDKSSPAFDPIQYGLLLLALLVMGVVYKLVSSSREAPVTIDS
jgi:uncharacterized membrane protein (DUF373 family)